MFEEKKIGKHLIKIMRQKSTVQKKKESLLWNDQSHSLNRDWTEKSKQNMEIIMNYQKREIVPKPTFVG